jgi:hypothetical protein
MTRKPFTSKLVASRGHLIYRVDGQDNQGKQRWYYLLVDKARESSFQEALRTGHLNVAEFGSILEFGYGAGPPQEVIRRLEKAYDIKLTA